MRDRRDRRESARRGAGGATAAGMPLETATPTPDQPSERPAWHRPIAAAAAVTALVTALSWLLPARHAATGVGLGFLGATWLLVLRGDEREVGEHGLSMGGLFESARLDARRLARDGGGALLWALGAGLLIFPPFVIGYRAYWHAGAPFHLVIPGSFADDVAGQLLVIALPEEAFFRGYLQTSLDRAWPPTVRLLGASVGPGLLVSSAIFAVGHVLTDPHPARLAVFFPSLLFGWMRARTGGVGAGVVFHASCNLFVMLLARGFGLVR
jgi:uncharacterized protein